MNGEPAADELDEFPEVDFGSARPNPYARLKPRTWPVRVQDVPLNHHPIEELAGVTPDEAALLRFHGTVTVEYLGGPDHDEFSLSAIAQTTGIPLERVKTLRETARKVTAR